MCMPVLTMVMAMVALRMLAVVMRGSRVLLRTQLFFRIYAGRQCKPQRGQCGQMFAGLSVQLFEDYGGLAHQQ